MRNAAIEGDRVRLMAPTLAIEDEFLAAVDASHDLHHPWVAPPSDRPTFEGYVRRMAREDHVGFVIRGADNDALAGVININNVVFRSFQSGQLGYYAFAGSTGQGLMGEALSLVIDHAFGYVGLHRLEANIQPDNHASIRLVRACGFWLEGLSPRYLFIDGDWRDHERWAITNEG